MFEEGVVSFGGGRKTVFVVHAGECSLASKTEYIDFVAAVEGWNKGVTYWFDKNERVAKKSKNAVKSLWGGA